MRTKLGLFFAKNNFCLKHPANSKVDKNVGRTLRKQYQDHQGLLRTIDNKIPQYVDWPIFFCVLEQVVGSASTNSLLLAGSVGLFGAGVVTKTAHQQFHASVYLYHK